MSGVIRIILDYPGLSIFWIILDMFGYIRIIRVYGMEGAAAEEGEAQTRNIESSYRRSLLVCQVEVCAYGSKDSLMSLCCP